MHWILGGYRLVLPGKSRQLNGRGLHVSGDSDVTSELVLPDGNVGGTIPELTG